MRFSECRFFQEDAISLLVAEARPALFEWLLLVLAILYSLLVYVLLKTKGSPAAMMELGKFSTCFVEKMLYSACLRNAEL